LVFFVPGLAQAFALVLGFGATGVGGRVAAVVVAVAATSGGALLAR